MLAHPHTTGGKDTNSLCLFLHIEAFVNGTRNKAFLFNLTANEKRISNIQARVTSRRKYISTKELERVEEKRKVQTPCGLINDYCTGFRTAHLQRSLSKALIKKPQEAYNDAFVTK